MFTMASTHPLILRLIASSIPVASNAGKIIRDVMKKGELNIVDKGIEDFQTEADRQAQLCIVKSLSQQFPGITIIGEEGEDDTESSGVVTIETDDSIFKNQCPAELLNVTENQITVWVDPLDGTSEYTQGLLEHVTVLIGIAVDEKAVAGIIHQPYFGYKNEGKIGRTIWGLIGLGAFGHTPNQLPKNRRILTTTRSHSSALVQEAINSLKADEVIRVGGAGNKVLLLLDGKAHAYVFASKGCKRWDTCAPEAVLVAAGGLLTDLNGNVYSYHKDTDHLNTGGVLATAIKEEHSTYLNLLPDSVKSQLK